MSFTAREFEKKLRAVHRAELDRSPELRREFKRRRKSESAIRSRLGRHLLMPVFWTAIFFAMIHRRNDVAWAAGIIALWSAGTALKWAHHWFHQFYASEDLVVLNQLPLNDRQIFQFQLRRYFGCAGWVAWELATEPHASLSRNGVLAILYSGIGSFLLAYLGWSYAVTRLGAARAGPWMHGVTAFGVLLAALLLGEYPAWYHFAGIGLILAGIFIASSASSSR